MRVKVKVKVRGGRMKWKGDDALDLGLIGSLLLG